MYSISKNITCHCTCIQNRECVNLPKYEPTPIGGLQDPLTANVLRIDNIYNNASNTPINSSKQLEQMIHFIVNQVI